MIDRLSGNAFSEERASCRPSFIVSYSRAILARERTIGELVPDEVPYYTELIRLKLDGRAKRPLFYGIERCVSVAAYGAMLDPEKKGVP